MNCKIVKFDEFVCRLDSGLPNTQLMADIPRHRRLPSRGAMEMQLITERFGTVEFDASQVLVFDEGLLGERRNRQWLLFADSRHRLLYWLQCISDSRISIPVVDAREIDRSYQVQVPIAAAAALGCSDERGLLVLLPLTIGSQVFSIDFFRPIVLSASLNRGRQLWNEQYQPKRWMGSETSSSLQKCA
jgi:flagellar assembly factor FliW